MKIQFADIAAAKSKLDAVIVFVVGADKKLSPLAATVNKQAGGAIVKALSSGKFAGKLGQYVTVIPSDGVKCDRIVLAGCGEIKKLNALAFEKIGGGLIPHLNGIGAKSATVLLDSPVASPEAAARIAHGAYLRSYRFDKYHTKTPADEKPTFVALTVALANSKAAAKPYHDLEKLAEGIFLTRNLVTEPPNIIYTESMAEECQKLEALGVEVDGTQDLRAVSIEYLLAQGNA